ncbi:AGE family epimerase/isomerase [Cellulomonas fimi]|uniref:AGE family epimerase/isomerase n=1 Tax=Cellulomonas fimi TaxID=1708 RepID=A0A7Y0LVB2_CELFI|nr:AGE family epimerase/isomerase [Cellulomonas fimi]
MDSPAHHAWLAAETRRLLEFGRGAALPDGGFGWLDRRGAVMPSVPPPLYVTCRMTHVYSLGALLGVEGSEALVDHGVAALRGRFRDAAHGGWFTAVGHDGSPADERKQAYPHSFVVLAASSALVAGRPGARELLDEALDVVERRFWDDDAGMMVEAWDRAFSKLDDYRGMNSNMHTVEAFLAAYAATGDGLWLDRATRITRRALAFAREHDWRLPEHFDPAWTPLLDHHIDTPDDPFRPYGSTMGHWLEWSRLALHVRAARMASSVCPHATDDDLLHDAVALFDAAVREGWHVDGAPGFVYTVDWTGTPRVRQRLHWVLCEALGAATTLWQGCGDDRFRDWYATWWAYADAHLLDRVDGSWHHELDPQNRPAETIRPGKADVYHALQATLLPRLPLGAALATAVRDQPPAP